MDAHISLTRLLPHTQIDFKILKVLLRNKSNMALGMQVF